MRQFLYRALIDLHPTVFRDRFGDEMQCVFDEAGRGSAPRFFVDAVLSLLRQWLLRSNLWKMASGAVISSLLLCAWGNSTAHGVDLSLAQGIQSRDRLAINPWLGGRETPLDKAEFRREAAQAIAILAEIRKIGAEKRRAQPHHAPRSAPNPSSSIRANKD